MNNEDSSRAKSSSKKARDKLRNRQSADSPARDEQTARDAKTQLSKRATTPRKQAARDNKDVATAKRTKNKASTKNAKRKTADGAPQEDVKDASTERRKASESNAKKIKQRASASPAAKFEPAKDVSTAKAKRSKTSTKRGKRANATTEEGKQGDANTEDVKQGESSTRVKRSDASSKRTKKSEAGAKNTKQEEDLAEDEEKKKFGDLTQFEQVNAPIKPAVSKVRVSKRHTSAGIKADNEHGQVTKEEEPGAENGAHAPEYECCAASVAVRETGENKDPNNSSDGAVNQERLKMRLSPKIEYTTEYKFIDNVWVQRFVPLFDSKMLDVQPPPPEPKPEPEPEK